MMPEEGLVVVRLGWTAGEYPLSRKVGELLTGLQNVR
ncbi:MAG: hypothetical protein ACJAQ8_003140 [Haliea salexigens]|jgi:hypothetical protein